MSESWMLAECDVRTSHLQVWAFRVQSVELNRYALWGLYTGSVLPASPWIVVETGMRRLATRSWR